MLEMTAHLQTPAPSPDISPDHVNGCRCRLPGVIVAVVLQGVPDPDLGSIESLRVRVDVGDVDREDFVSLVQIQPPPGTDVVAGVRAGAMLPPAVAVPVDGVGRSTEQVKGRLAGFSSEGHVLPCRSSGRVH